jgi:hypothetical protein
MKHLSSHPANQYALIRTLVGEIEALREKRRALAVQQPAPTGKRFTQEDLAEHCHISYKNLLYGYTKRLPSRAQVLQIADYLECTIAETNDLLRAAEYMPIQAELRDDQEQAVLEQATFYAHTLPLPAIVFRRGWEIVAANRFQLTLNNLVALETIPREQRTAVHWFCDSALPPHHVHSPDPATWQANIDGVAGFFRAALQPFQREAWYRTHMDRWRTLPKFAQAWERANTTLDSAAQIEFATTTTSAFVPTLIRERSLIAPLGPMGFPLIIVTFPWDEGARVTYRQVGCAISEDGWERAVGDVRALAVAE